MLKCWEKGKLQNVVGNSAKKVESKEQGFSNDTELEIK